MKQAFRRALSKARWAELERAVQRPELSLCMRSALRLKGFLEEEDIVRMPGERIYGWRTLTDFPDIYAPGEREALQAGHYVHEQGRVFNISSDWGGVLSEGLEGRRAKAEQTLRAGRGDADFLRAALIVLDAMILYADRYGDAGLSGAIRYGARSFLQALQMFRILHFALWASNAYHNTVGRFDQYMWPYVRADWEAGRLDEAQTLSLLEEFFRSFTRDSDLYIGMQQGDNGQSLMLGGCDRDGQCAVNPLTHLCLTASLHNRQIDPKINLRVDRNTPPALYERCTELTRQGLGFPQYANDDVVIPGLVRLGYTLEDARDYTVAACWEFIIPGVGMDIANIGAISLAAVVDRCIRKGLKARDSYEDLESRVRKALREDAHSLAERVRPLYLEPSPYQSVLMRDCLERGRDISRGGRYNHYGVHGTGFANAVDQLASVRHFVYEKGMVEPGRLGRALETDYGADEALRMRLRREGPKLGRDAGVTPLADFLLDAFADAFEGLVNERGGCFRPGTGSAMYYVWHAESLRATADGRASGERLSANFSPSLLVGDAGPLSVVEAFARPKLRRVINGGPLTLELHDTVLRNAEGMAKVANLVRAFIRKGGHQLQINALDRQTLLDAQNHPEAHRNLIVRVWGWSGHFVQLDRVYQDQIIARTAYRL